MDQVGRDLQIIVRFLRSSLWSCFVDHSWIEENSEFLLQEIKKNSIITSAAAASGSLCSLFSWRSPVVGSSFTSSASYSAGRSPCHVSSLNGCGSPSVSPSSSWRHLILNTWPDRGEEKQLFSCVVIMWELNRFWFKQQQNTRSREAKRDTETLRMQREAWFNGLSGH